MLALFHGGRVRCCGLTGSIAVGKSAVSAELRACGVTVIDADTVARQVVAPGTPALQRLVAILGRGILSAADGSLDRAELRKRMALDPAVRAQLNAVLHPAIAMEILMRLAVDRWLLGRRVVIDAALLHESFGFAGRLLCCPVLCVTAPSALQLQWLTQRDGCSLPEAEALVAAQRPQEWKAARSDLVLRNEGSLGELQAAVRALLPRLF